MDEFRMCQEIKVKLVYLCFQTKIKIGKTMFLVEKIQVRHEEKGRVTTIVCIT